MLDFYMKNIKNKIFNKMILIYSVITIVSMYLLMQTFIDSYTRNEMQNELKTHSEIIFNFKKSFESKHNVAYSIANRINTQPQIVEEIKVVTENDYEEYLSYKLDRYFSSDAKQIDLDYLVDIMLSSRGDVLGVIINDKDKGYNMERVINQEKWNKLTDNKSGHKTSIKIRNPIKDIDTISTIGYVDVYFDLEDMKKTVSNSDLKGSLMVFDNNNRMIFNSSKRFEEESIDRCLSFNEIVNKINKDNDIKHDKYSVINIEEDPYIGYKYISVIVENDLLLSKVKNKIYILAMLSIIVILTITITAIYSHSLKLKKIIKVINKLKKGDLNVRSGISYENDELDMIAISIDDMSENLQYNINKTYIAEVKQKEAEISALQAQINPHFLYNTLEVIRMCALASKNKDVAQMVYNLASMFRYSTYDNGSEVKLKDEIKYCNMYLNLCKARYANMINYNINIEDKYLNYLLPKFTMQPILENSINHGLRSNVSKENINIEINILELEEGIELVIKDDGGGINKDKLEEVRVNLEKNVQKKNSIGLMNINNRVKLKFGERYGINIESIEDEGTIVRVKLPVLRGV